jgi:uncharacterized protein (DUF302 family)
VKSAYLFDETITRLKQDIENKGIVFFSAIVQAKLGADANITLKPSMLLMFGNPPNAGIDWPVRLIVNQDDHGQV